MLWNGKFAPGRRPKPLGFLETCQPTHASAPPTGAGWLHEVKHDGYRVIARTKDGNVCLWSREGADFTRHFSGITEAVARIGIDCVLDGEAVASHFDALQNSEASSGAVLLAFDVLEVEGFDFRSQPLERRRAMLAELLTPPPQGVLLSEAIEGNGPNVFRHACGMGLEGIVSKRLRSKYEAGRSPDWVKIKNPNWTRR
jgi:bifunctional non-homologous end joining protein LigD